MFPTHYLDWIFGTHPHRDQALPTDSETSEAEEPTCTETEELCVPAIPQDMVHEILDHLVADPGFRPSLRSCSLVSKSSADTFQWIMTFPVPERSPAHHARELNLLLEGYSYVPHEFFKRIQSFTNVKTVTMSGGRDKDWWRIYSSGGLPQSLDRPLANLEHHAAATQLEQLFVIWASSHGGAAGCRYGENSGGGGKFRGRLQLYELERCYTSVVNTLLEVPTGLRFTELDIRASHKYFLSTVSLAEACGESLMRLSYTVIDYERVQWEDLDRTFDFVQFPNLREARFKVHWADGSLLWIHKALSTIKPDTSRFHALQLDLSTLSPPRLDSTSQEISKSL
ncbi:hypothetical protein BJ322DRAFT_1023172 [Thelephora terrestris]|uniref:Uncharacterized protein n=1 Tax=Thelephora terrestris TaxID=56493 RepID=A0A9P6H9H2_9AGAM|nr:hypothetical protein BJ322DRAFT_1023172 [Thelephora terrestris]